MARGRFGVTVCPLVNRTVCPDKWTVCPDKWTVCPENRTVCPDERSVSPDYELYKQPVLRTVCPC